MQEDSLNSGDRFYLSSRQKKIARFKFSSEKEIRVSTKLHVDSEAGSSQVTHFNLVNHSIRIAVGLAPLLSLFSRLLVIQHPSLAAIL
jgi:hypothetical protein